MKLAKTAQGHDIVVLGGSVGGVEAMQSIVAAFPADLKAAVFVVIHTAPGYDSALPEILSRKTPLKVTHAIHGEPVELGHHYVAPPDNHMLVRPGYLAVHGALAAPDGEAVAEADGNVSSINKRAR